MKIFSTFSWIGGFELGIIQAFGKENVELIGYSEIDQFSCAVLAHHFPAVKNYGDIKQIEASDLPDFDVLVGGSPCQDLSISKQNRQGLMGAKSELFFEYVRLLRSKKPRYFVLENVASMKNDDRDFISETLGVEPIKINSAAFTAQHRNRYYRTNIPWVKVPESNGFSLHDCLEKEVDAKYFVNWKARKGKQIYLKGDEITPCSLIEVRTDKGRAERKQNKAIFGIDRNARNKETSMYIATNKAKTNCLTGAIHAVNLLVIKKNNELLVRMPTPIECERFQGFPDDRTLVPRKNRMMSDTQRYKQTGNAVTVNVIAYIFWSLKTHLEQEDKALQAYGLTSWFVTPNSKKEKLSKTEQKALQSYNLTSWFVTPNGKKEKLAKTEGKALQAYNLTSWFVTSNGKKEKLAKTEGKALQAYNLTSWFVTPSGRKKRVIKSQKKYVAYCHYTKWSSWSLDVQKSVIEYFTKLDKAQIIETFIEEDSATQPILKQTIKYCKKKQATLIVSRLDRLSLDIDKLYSIKKQLGDQLIACDLPQTDRLTISIHLGVLQRQKLLNSIRRKASIATKKAAGKVYGNPQNFTVAGRKLGLKKIKLNASTHPKKQKILEMVQKCQALNMSYGAIAEALNQNGFRTVRGKLFVRNTVRRLLV